MFNTKYRAVQSIEQYEDQWQIFSRKWYSIFWKATNIYCHYYEDAMSVIEMLKADENE